MPLNKEWCDCCGTQKTECPDCGSHTVTPRDNLRLPSPTELVDCGLQEEYEDVKGVESEGEFEYKHVCWACGWTETVTISITRD